MIVNFPNERVKRLAIDSNADPDPAIQKLNWQRWTAMPENQKYMVGPN